jgi:outer membrane lipoprotein SlyB
MKATTALILIALTGCASMGAQYVPLVDMAGRDQSRFNSDVAECQSFAARRIDAGNFAVVGAIATGLLGAFLAPRGFRNEVAGHAAVLGALGGGGEGLGTQREIIIRCMAGRGYNVLN